MKNHLRKLEWRGGRLYRFMPYPIHRDNKENYNISSGSSGYRGNTIRFPKKNRSKRTWRAFYKLFPGIPVDKKRI
jgi:hypothetical protein